ncbi:MAG: hypothetical protein COU29_00550 [Candidatus Magasanikbacteria bacterium CG10_big_fil_rev_8_21_14_0_10_36_32]|uniref:Uncharacterized protein n=1 Tax=Candidatus Magasanikbacteria bacterium CG10_big_fil_rev_8_21_14_0_10_36_32 TaxID=1974646 RepID=A0A2M6W7J2_9BACT|nr:MAG: hypothetical protein COU29_00550 [Candidatus Magasanikbacteria bacterium CG10_big_fil_rev_8_21_14_0_10_36_32]
MASIVRQLNDTELREKNLVYFGFDTQEMEGFWNALHEYFNEASPSDDRQYWWSFFRWYTDATWQDMTRIDRDVFERIAVGRQIPMALILGFDVWNRIMAYLSLKGLDEEDTQNLYVKIRVAFLNSEAIVGYGKGNSEIKIVDLIKELTLINSRGRDSMAMAEFYEKIKNLLFPSNDSWLKEFIDVDYKEAVMKMVDLMDFFITVESDDLPGIMDMYLHSELYPTASTVAPTSAKQVQSISFNQPETVKEKKVVLPAKKTEVKAIVSTPTPIPPKPVKPPVPSYLDIKKEVNLVFKKDQDGEFVDLDGVLNKLSELAVKYSDNKIAELYYFDEKENKFKWGV